MLLTYNEIRKLVDAGVVGNAAHANINAASLDVTLGKYLWIEDQRGGTIDIATKLGPGMYRYDLEERGTYDLQPGEFVLAQTQEMFYLPDDIAFEYKLKSSQARAGLSHLLAGYADPGWRGSVLTLEFVNATRYHQIRLTYGMKAGQIVFYRGEPVPRHASYAVRGRYNNDTAATPTRGVE